MSIAVNIEKTMGDFQLNTEFYADIGITAIFGPSGAGKSTLVNLIAGLVKPDTGYIKILNEVIFESQQKINVPVGCRHPPGHHQYGPSGHLQRRRCRCSSGVAGAGASDRMGSRNDELDRLAFGADLRRTVSGAGTPPCPGT